MLDLLRFGELWWAGASLASSTDLNLVVPRPTTRGVVPQGAGDRNMEENALILLGYHYEYTAAAGNGFDLVWQDHGVATPSNPTERVIFRSRASASRLDVSANMAFCFIPGPDGQFTPMADGADLRINFTATGPTAGWITAWGLHVDSATLRTLGKQFTGSPVAF